MAGWLGNYDENGNPIPAPLTPQQQLEQNQALAIARINAMFNGTPEHMPITRAWGDPIPATPGRSGVYDDVRKYNYDASKQLLDDQAEKTRRNLGFALADKGLFGGSADIDAHGQENRGYSQALIKAADSAQGASDQVRANDESTRLNLLSSIRNGADSDTAAQSALAQMQNNVSAGRSNATTGAVDAYLSSVAPVINQQQQQAGVTQARTMYGAPGIYGRAPNYSGQTN